jgi:hypothetical protein
VSALADVLTGEAWLRCDWPFPHIVARNVFEPDFYEALELQIRGFLRLGLSEDPDYERFSRNLPGYDAYGRGLGLGLGRADDPPTSVFLTPAWRDFICRIYEIGPTPYVFAGAHHHTPGSASGFIHNDFNSVWFPRAEDGGMQIPNQELCSFKTGSGPLAPEDKVEVVRAAVVIFFLANDPHWLPGDGGETGLYASRDRFVGVPDASWPPENNSLISFECTPQSFHGFISNTRSPRTSIIMWVHRTREEAARLYGADQLEQWKL